MLKAELCGQMWKPFLPASKLEADLKISLLFVVRICFIVVFGVRQSYLQTASF